MSERGRITPPLSKAVAVSGLLLGLIVLYCRPAPAQADPVDLQRTRMGGAEVNVVRVDLTAPGVRVEPVLTPSPAPRPGQRAAFRRFLDCYSPVAAINGTFFCTRTWRIIGNIVVKGRLVNEGYIGNAIALDQDNRPSFIRNAGQMGHRTRWDNYRAAIGGGLTLLVNGREAINPRRDGFHDPGLFRLTSRSAIGFTRSCKLLLVSVRGRVSFHQLALIMKRLGAECALSLDGGSSSAMYYRGRVLASPHRLLTNLVAVFVEEVKPPLLTRIARRAERRGKAKGAAQRCATVLCVAQPLDRSHWRSLARAADLLACLRQCGHVPWWHGVMTLAVPRTPEAPVGAVEADRVDPAAVFAAEVGGSVGEPGTTAQHAIIVATLLAAGVAVASGRRPLPYVTRHVQGTEGGGAARV
jgi:hypothetical protein